MNHRTIRLAVSALTAVSGLYLFASVLASAVSADVSLLLTGPGRFLTLCFGGVSLYVPLFFLASAFLLGADLIDRKSYSILLFSLLPFLTLSLLLKLGDYGSGRPAVELLAGSFGRRGASLLVGLVLLVEILLLAKLLTGRGRSGETGFAAEETGDKYPYRPILEETRGNSERTAAGVHDGILKDEPVNEGDTFSGPDSAAELFPEPEDDFETEPEDAPEEELEEESGYEPEDEPEYEIVPFPEPEDFTEPEQAVVEGGWDSEPEDEIEEIILEQFGGETIEPLDLEEAAGSTIDSETSSVIVETIEVADEEPHVIRGDEDLIASDASAVWQEARKLGLLEEEPETEEKEEDELPDDDISVLPEDAAFDIEVESGEIRLEEDFLGSSYEDDTDDDIDDDTGDDTGDYIAESVVEEVLSEDPDDYEEDEDPEVDEDLVHDEAIEDVVNAEEPPVRVPVKRGRVEYSVPVEDLLEDYGNQSYWIIDEDTQAAAEVLKETLKEFRIAAEVTGISKGPVITMFEILPAPGVKLSKIVNLADNIALRLAASRVRIVAPIPGKHAVGIEVPNKERAIVSFKEILESANLGKSRMSIPVVLGKDITGGARVIDLVQTPHMLIAGATGSGKSVCVNSLICSILYSRKPDEVKMILIDPKIVELKMYNDIPHLLTPVITEPKKAFQALQYCICEMERRYSLLDSLGVRDIKSYNKRVGEGRYAVEPLPYIVIIVDEFADLMATTGKELEGVIARLAAMSRAVGIHLVLATQRPSVDVITGLIKANIPSRIAFMVASKMDSRIILDAIGADKLLGKGDMLLTSAWDPNPVRIQGAFLSEEEVERVSDYVKSLGEPEYIDDEIFMPDEYSGDFELEQAAGGDPLMETAISIVVEAGKASASYLQRRLKIGYNRAARLVEEMEERGIVGPANGSKPRDIIHIPDRV